MRSVAWHIGIAAILFGGLLIPSCGEENPVEPDDDPIVTIDSIPPATIAALTLRSPTTSAISLVWNAPGDDGVTGRAAAYDIRYATFRITEQNWDTATPVAGVPPPRPSGQLETLVVPNLKSITRYYFAIKTLDEVPNTSMLSNCPDTVTLQEFNPPVTVSDLRGVTVSDNEVLLLWTAPGDDGLTGLAEEYDIRYSYWPLTNQTWGSAIKFTGLPAPKPGGHPDSFLVSGFPPDSSFYFGLKAADEVPNWSGLSNTPLVLGHQISIDVDPSTIHQNDHEAIVYFKTSSQRVTIKIYRVRIHGDDELFRSLVNGFFEPGTHSATWDIKGDDGQDPLSGWNYRFELRWGSTLKAEKIVRVL